MAIPELDLKKVNLQAAVGYLISLHDNEVDWNLLGIRVIGAIDALPIPAGDYEYGDAYMVGTETPYDMYIYTRPDGKVHTEGYWFPIGKFPAPGPQGPKGDGLEQITREASNTAQSVSYDSTSGATIEYTDKTVIYKDSTTGEVKTKTWPAQLSLPIVPGKYISMDANSDNDALEVKVDDTALSLDYIKLNKTKNSVIPEFYNGKIQWDTLTVGLGPLSVVQRSVDNSTYLNKLYVNRLSTTAGEYNMPLQAAYYGGFSDGFTIEKTTTDTGTMAEQVFDAIKSYPNAGLKYDNRSYIRMDPTNAPDGTLNFIHIDALQNGEGGYKATGKCFSITVSTRAWQVVDIDFGGASRTTHNLTITNSATGTSIYFSLTNNRTETYEGAPAGLWSALENSPIACTVNNNGTYAAGIITIDGDNFKVMYGNSEELLMTQTQVGITDNVI
nr:MAG TPA: hypothetical protein [Bacteriophage sp.]